MQPASSAQASLSTLRSDDWHADGGQPAGILNYPANQRNNRFWFFASLQSSLTAKILSFMSRKTSSLSAIAIAAVAGISFSSTNGAEALAQVIKDDPVAIEQANTAQLTDQDTESSEIVPPDASAEREITFISEAVTQELPADGVVGAGSLSDVGSLGELVSAVEPGELTDQMRCLASAVCFEARGERLAGQLAVAQVVINRADDARWPASYCGVVYQRAQFSFVKNGRMPRVRTSSGAWQRAKAIAQIAHSGLWESEAGEAVYFHAKHVRPKWSYRKQRTARIDTHIFYR